ncbi:hypothetical protein [Halomonas sp. DWK9]|uniref:hypothetical protein n=1 Tax=Halomonas sp. DWK9 TaxID=3060155 RepID=UPI00287F9126|nr:hypothetical protein [Halomonas sp. DWK9]
MLVALSTSRTLPDAPEASTPLRKDAHSLPAPSGLFTAWPRIVTIPALLSYPNSLHWHCESR